MKKNIPKIREWEENEKKHSDSERESEAVILGNGREREFQLTPDWGDGGAWEAGEAKDFKVQFRSR